MRQHEHLRRALTEANTTHDPGTDQPRGAGEARRGAEFYWSFMTTLVDRFV